jgi:hypothetical protein
MLQLNVIKTPDDADFAYVKQLCDEHKGWTIRYHKKNIRVWTKQTVETDFNMIKVCVPHVCARTHARCVQAHAYFDDVDADTLYDVMHDSDYRPTWDKYMLGSNEIGLINPNNDVCYYACAYVCACAHFTATHMQCVAWHLCVIETLCFNAVGWISVTKSTYSTTASVTMYALAHTCAHIAGLPATQGHCAWCHLPHRLSNTTGRHEARQPTLIRHTR